MLNNFSIRSDKSELLDGTNIERSLIIKNLHELDILNRTTGAHNLSIKALKNLLTDHQKTYHIVDLGCGSGDALIAMAAWARKKKL